MVRFRSRSWRDSAWGSRASEGRLVAPSHDISRGYIIRVLDKGVVRFYATTLIYRDFHDPEPPPELDAEDVVAPELREPCTEVGWPPLIGSGEIQVEGIGKAPLIDRAEGFASVPSASAESSKPL